MTTWATTSYTNNTWTKLVGDIADISCIIIANTSGGALNASVRLATAAGVERSVLLPTKEIAASESETFSIPGFKTGPGDVIEVRGSGAGIHFTASGDLRG